jgi:hypothetical protein
LPALPETPQGRSSKGFVLAMSAALFLCTAPSVVAFAAAGESDLGLALGGGQVSTSGALHGRLTAGYIYNVTDLFGVGATVVGSVSDAGPDIATHVVARMIIDALTWVPSIAAGIGVGSYGTGLLQARGQAELAYRPTRSNALFARLCGEVGGAEGLPITFAFEVGYRWHTSPAGDLDF